MKLSIIISVHNLQEYIGQCLDSVVDIGMPEKDYEIHLRLSSLYRIN